MDAAIRAARQPLTWLMLLAVALLTLLALESATGSPAPSLVPLQNVTNSSSHTDTAKTNLAHCTDGKGKDVTANKHCLSNQ
jgi:hypothetical protein